MWAAKDCGECVVIYYTMLLYIYIMYITLTGRGQCVCYKFSKVIVTQEINVEKKT